jgi:hypothetical protein
MVHPEIYPSPEQMTTTNTELVAMVRGRLPMRFYAGEAWWSVYCTASLVRMADTVETLMELLPTRSLYEQVVTFAWIAIDPSARHQRWEGEAKIQMAKLHHDALSFGEQILSEEEVAATRASKGLPPLTDMALEADKHWSGRIDGLHPDGHLLGFRGLYLSIYRLGSRPAHGSMLALEPYVTHVERRIVVDTARQGTLLWYSLIAPLFSIGLVVAAQRFHWLDEVNIREIAERAVTPAEP